MEPNDEIEAILTLSRHYEVNTEDIIDSLTGTLFDEEEAGDLNVRVSMRLENAGDHLVEGLLSGLKAKYEE